MPTIRDRLAKVLMTQVPAALPRAFKVSPPAEGQPPVEGPQTLNAPIFANYKAATFPSLVGFVSAIWLGLIQTGAGWAGSRWVPLALCLLFGGTLTVLELLEDDVTPRPRKVWGAMVGLGNCFVLYSAVVGATAMIGGAHR